MGRAATTDARWIGPDGAVLFGSLAALRGGTAMSPLPPAGAGVWTGCDRTGVTSSSCNDWTSTTLSGVTGAPDEPADGGWSSSAGQRCNSLLPLYCFEYEK